MEKEKIEAKARKMFPIGTKFFPAHQLRNFEKYNKYYCINTNNNFSWIDKELCILSDDGRIWVNYPEEPKYGNNLLNRVVYSNGDFAKIISTSNKNYELWER